ncbi:MAG TPA: pantetheine-phosphate adenylyltransferase [Candidatus Krumholzibacteria bacterium]|nr:pantetheine-phosphate adenylyltransferase [Candidatus Krumholzibacteria bacterium]
MSDRERRVALYPGTFDPLTNGHMDIVVRASSLFDSVLIAVADSAKKSPMLTLEVRCDLVRGACADMPRVSVRPFTGLLAAEYGPLGIDVVIKGLRSMTDFEYEFQQAQANRRLQTRFETVFFMPSDRNTCISSSLVREIYALGGDVRDFVPENVWRHLEAARAGAPQHHQEGRA